MWSFDGERLAPGPDLQIQYLGVNSVLGLGSSTLSISPVNRLQSE